MSDALGVGTVSVELNNTLAELLAKLCIELDTEDYTGVLSRALGLLGVSAPDAMARLDEDDDADTQD